MRGRYIRVMDERESDVDEDEEDLGGFSHSPQLSPDLKIALEETGCGSRWE
jgi:hypothetical protein